LLCALSPVETVLAKNSVVGAASRAGSNAASTAGASIGGRDAPLPIIVGSLSTSGLQTLSVSIAASPVWTVRAVAVSVAAGHQDEGRAVASWTSAQVPGPITTVIAANHETLTTNVDVSVVVPDAGAPDKLSFAQYWEWAGTFFDRSKPRLTRSERLLSRGERTIAFLPPVLQVPITGAVSSRLGKYVLPTAFRARWGHVPPASAPKPAYDTDDFGGPKYVPMNIRGRLALGARYGVMLTGAAFAVEYAVALLTSLPLEWLGSGALESVGRVELLISMGPRLLAETLKEHPFWFLAVDLPKQLFIEELGYRGLQFFGYFGVAMAVRWGLARFSALINAVPDIGYVRSTEQWIAAKLISKPYFPAAWLIASNFAAAHALHWGNNPGVFFTQFVAGLILARAAYRTRSLLAPFTAHLVFSLLTMASMVLALHFLLPGAAAAYQLALGIGSIGYLAYRLARRAVLKRLALKALVSAPPAFPVEPA
jgi:hypothetical protein